MPEQKYDDLTGDHQPQSAALKVVAALPVFAGLFIQTVVEGEQSDGGYAINLRRNRHEEGRTFLGAGRRTAIAFRTQLVARIAAAGPDVVKQRTAALDLLKEELTADVAKVRGIVRRSDSDPKAWGDIHALPRLSPDGQKRLIQKVRAKILEGEDRIAAQNLDRLTYRRP